MKRQRTMNNKGYTTKRPIDKRLKAFGGDLTTTAQDSNIVYAASYPGTVTGLRWEISAINNNTAAANNITWAIVVNRDGLAPPTLGFNGDFYTPEENVLAFGQQVIHAKGTGDSKGVWQGNTKTMRKLQGGDEILLLVRTSVNASMTYVGLVQMFVKT